MAEIPNTFTANPPPPPKRGVVEVIMASVTEALGSAFVLWILGGVAISIASSFAGDMVPSLPPWFAAPAQSGAHHHHAVHFHAWWPTLHGYAFTFFFAIFFAHSLWHNFHSAGVGPATRLRRILFKLREDWFSLIVGNALSAWVAVLLLGLMPDFSLWHMFWHWVWELIGPNVEGIGKSLFGSSTSSGFGGWFSWYGENQSKLAFWFIFFAGAFDDLGVPNFKSLARWGWRRYRKRNPQTAMPEAPQI